MKPDYVVSSNYNLLCKLAVVHGENLSVVRRADGWHASILIEGQYGADLHRAVVTQEQAERLVDLAFLGDVPDTTN